MCRHRRYGIYRLLIDLHRKADHIMATQQDIDAFVSRIDTAISGIRADIEQIKAAHPELDLSGLESRVADLEGLDAENPAADPTPAEPTPSEPPAEPMGDDTDTPSGR